MATIGVIVNKDKKEIMLATPNEEIRYLGHVVRMTPTVPISKGIIKRNADRKMKICLKDQVLDSAN